MAYLVAVVWAVMESNNRWMTFLWTTGSLVAVIGVLWILSLIWPFAASILGDVAAILGLVISGFVGLNHMRAHRRKPPGAPQP